ncbi:MAG TPA: S41 family peptidase [Candidatus Aminicenantes bacterium]|nr:S41 family peptidase [Candidatus Aminicenantes bacterium]HRY65615.1 S41 family peptidase [Candidatus Aminicenantes bacterium]HRZ72497.1 S41 family peptidase [Candidatus Aminicenantes bacterium]
MKKKVAFNCAVFVLFLILPGPAQDRATTLTRAEIAQAVDKVCQLLNRFYVLPEVATRMERHIRAKLEAGTFDRMTDSDEFLEAMTRELRSVCHDKHLAMFKGANPDERSKEERDLDRFAGQFESKRRNFGLDKVEILGGNVGYLRIRSVMYSREAMEVVSAALKFLENTDALIIDLRENRGGDPAYMASVLSYFFEKPTHINSIYWKDRDRTDEFWTKESVPGKKLVDLPLYVLVSGQTFSGAEEFAYDLQALKRAVVIGEKSAGGANPASSWVVYKDLRISIPYGRAINPTTGTNWEGVGVKPDIETGADKALEAAVAVAEPAAEDRRAKMMENLLAAYNECSSSLKQAEMLFLQKKTEEAETLVLSILKRAIERKVMDQSSINQKGYELLRQESRAMAIAVFKCNAQAYPGSANVYDSLGEAYLANGDIQLAIDSYRRALALEPGLESAKRALEKIRK